MRTRILAALAGVATLCIGARAGGAGLDTLPDGRPPNGISEGTRAPVGEPDLGVIDGSRSHSTAVPVRHRRGGRSGRRRQIVRPASQPRDVGNNSDANGGSSTTVTPPVPPSGPTPFAR
jgi:hypothetical protein